MTNASASCEVIIRLKRIRVIKCTNGGEVISADCQTIYRPIGRNKGRIGN